MEKWGEEEEAMLQDAEEASQLKSVAQLRAKGENSRFVDGFGYLVEGLESGMGIDIRRASAIEILRKIEDAEFVRRLKAAGLVEKVYVCFREAEAGSGDKVLDACLAFLVASLGRDPRVGEPLLRAEAPSSPRKTSPDSAVEQGPEACDVLLVLVAMAGRYGHAEEIANHGRGGKAAKAQSRSLGYIRDIINRSGLLSDDGIMPVSTRTLSLLALSNFAAYHSRPTLSTPPLLLAAGGLDALVGALLHDAAALEKRLELYRGGVAFLPSPPAFDTPSFTLLGHLLRAIETCTASVPGGSVETSIELLLPHLVTFASALSTLLIATTTFLFTPPTSISSTEGHADHSDEEEAAMDVLLLTTRLSSHLTMSPEVSLALAESPGFIANLVKVLAASRVAPARAPPPRVKLVSDVPTSDSVEVFDGDADEDESNKDNVDEQRRYDLLCVALGVLINLAEMVSSVPEVLQSSAITLDCEERRKCVEAGGCHCTVSGTKTGVEWLIELFLDPLEDCSVEVTRVFIQGFLSLLLGLVMANSPSVLATTLATLNTRPDGSKLLHRIIVAVDEYATLHEKREEGSQESTQSQKSVEVEMVDGGEEGEGIKESVAVKLRGLLKHLKA